MVPVDAAIGLQRRHPAVVDVGQVIEAFRAAGNRMNIVVLDACCDNPFAGTAWARAGAARTPPGTFPWLSPRRQATAGATRCPAAATALYTRFPAGGCFETAGPAIENVFKRAPNGAARLRAARSWESTSLRTTSSSTRQGGHAGRRKARGSLPRREGRLGPYPRQPQRRGLLRLPAWHPTGAIAQNANAAGAPGGGADGGGGGSQRHRATPWGHATGVGDYTEFARKDLYTGLEIERNRTRVTRIADGIVEFQQRPGMTTPRWRRHQEPVRAPVGPAAHGLSWAKPTVGKRWTGRTIETALDGSTTWREDSAHAALGMSPCRGRQLGPSASR